MNDDLVFSVLCPRCGEIDLGYDQVWLVVASTPDRSHYCFHCTRCGQLERVHATDAVVAILAELVAVEALDVPAEALEAHHGSALTLDDLLDLMLALDAPHQSTPAELTRH